MIEDDDYSTTSEPEHAHECPVCGDLWKHKDSECQEPKFGLRTTEATCPMHQE